MWRRYCKYALEPPLGCLEALVSDKMKVGWCLLSPRMKAWVALLKTGYPLALGMKLPAGSQMFFTGSAAQRAIAPWLGGKGLLKSSAAVSDYTLPGERVYTH